MGLVRRRLHDGCSLPWLVQSGCQPARDAVVVELGCRVFGSVLNPSTSSSRGFPIFSTSRTHSSETLRLGIWYFSHRSSVCRGVLLARKTKTRLPRLLSAHVFIGRSLPGVGKLRVFHAPHSFNRRETLENGRRPCCSLGRPLRVVKKMRGFFLGLTIAQTRSDVGNVYYANAQEYSSLGL